MAWTEQPRFSPKEKQALEYIDRSWPGIHITYGFDASPELRRILDNIKVGIRIGPKYVRLARANWLWHTALVAESSKRIADGRPVPDDIRRYTMAVHTGREKPPRKTRDTSVRDILLFIAINDIAARFGICATRNPGTTGHHSACSLLAWTLRNRKEGTALTENTLNRVWSGRGKR